MKPLPTPRVGRRWRRNISSSGLDSSSLSSSFSAISGWGWVVLNGVISVILGAAIWRQWPLSGLWVIGLFVGIEMLFSGLSWVMLGLAVRSAPKAVLPS